MEEEKEANENPQIPTKARIGGIGIELDWEPLTQIDENSPQIEGRFLT